MNRNSFGTSKFDPGGHCRHWRAAARACQDTGRQGQFPGTPEILLAASAVIVPGLVLAEADYFLRADRRVMRKLIAEIFDPATRYEYELPLPGDIARAFELDARFGELDLGSSTER